MEVYTALFDQDNKALQQTNALIVEEGSFDTYYNKQQKVVFSGNGAEKCKSLIASPYSVFSATFCSATNLVPLAIEAYEKGDFVNIAYFSPDYHKAPNITTPKKIL